MIVAFEDQINSKIDEGDWNHMEVSAKQKNVQNLQATNESKLEKEIKELEKNDLERLKRQCKVVVGVGGGVGTVTAAAAGGRLTFLVVTTGITTTAGLIGAGVATGKIAIAAAGLEIGIAGIVKTAKKGEEEKKDNR